ncbi:MAG: cytochrome P450 [Sphingomonadaceae bacterium]|nr:cytochrome P450 [Sphingomonadaceae bacterium]
MLALAHESYRRAGWRGPRHPPIHPATGIVDLANFELFRKGHPVAGYARLHAEAPIYWQDEPVEAEPGYWAISRYADVKAISKDPESFSSQKGGINIAYGDPADMHPLLTPGALDNMIALDGEPHVELRRQHMPFFTPGYIRRLTARVDVKVAELLDALATKAPRCNLVDAFAAELPLFTLAELLGVDQADRPRLAQWMADLEMAIYFGAVREGQLAPTPEIIAAYNGWEERIREFFDYGMREIRDRQANPRDDLMSAIANAVVDGGPMPDMYLAGAWELIFIAGNDTTRNSISGMMRLLSENPEQKAKLLANMDLLPNAIQEAVRLISPVIYMKRTATRDAEVGGQSIAEGEKLVMYYGAANRDPAVFADPDRFDVARENAAQHLAFGFGKHVCLGRQIALMQLESAYRQLLARFPDMTMDGEMVCAPNNFVHAITEMPVRFSR